MYLLLEFLARLHVGAISLLACVHVALHLFLQE
jgi:hypothetical protein